MSDYGFKLSLVLVFCYQNSSDLLWEKNVLVIEKNFFNSRLKAENLQKFWHHKNNLFKQWKSEQYYQELQLWWSQSYVRYFGYFCEEQKKGM